MKRIKRAKKVKGSESKFFRGEVMICAVCGLQEKSDPHVSSNWTVVEVEGAQPQYVCPVCWLWVSGQVD